MKTLKHLILNKINITLGVIIGLAGIGVVTSVTSCDNNVYNLVEPDSVRIDSTIHLMYGVTPVEFHVPDSGQTDSDN